MRIRQLSPAVANQIAAGEVIERPASVVKELLENALDAHADMISVEVGYGGLNQVKISDNGVGIVAEDLPLAIEAHATSKISQLDDLYAISSMGFRGEALASIASIARVSISSKPATQTNGMLLTCRDGAIKLSPIARTQGTTIDVRDIFFNAPVRKKFLKSERYEFQAIEAIVKRFALSCPAVGIKLFHNEKPLLHLSAALDEPSRLARVTKLLGKPFIEEAIEVDVLQPGLSLQGWISGLAYQRSQNDKLWVYINGRMVKDRLINHAIKQAYDNRLHPGRHPACLLYLTLKPSEVDINVHPTKHEVRFQQPRLIHDFISTHLSQLLNASFADTTYTIPVDFAEHQVRETALVSHRYEQTLLPYPREHLNRIHSWQVLHDRFSFCYINEEPYLLDLPKLHTVCLLDQLKKASFPLACRPLLVPVSYTMPSLNADSLRFSQILLKQLGIEIEPSQEHILLRTLPVMGSNLMIKTFLTSFFGLSIPSLEQALELLAEHQVVDNRTISAEQQEIYTSYLQSITSTKLNTAFIKPLTERVCQGLFND